MAAPATSTKVVSVSVPAILAERALVERVAYELGEPPPKPRATTVVPVSFGADWGPMMTDDYMLRLEQVRASWERLASIIEAANAKGITLLDSGPEWQAYQGDIGGWSQFYWQEKDSPPMLFSGTHQLGAWDDRAVAWGELFVKKLNERQSPTDKNKITVGPVAKGGFSAPGTGEGLGLLPQQSLDSLTSGLKTIGYIALAGLGLYIAVPIVTALPSRKK
jgi:hypothetical protein